MYEAAPGCGFKKTRYSTELKRHLSKKGWCPCKDAGWTVAMGKEGQVDRRKIRQQQTIDVQGDHNSVINSNNTTTTININVNVDGKILPSGSPAEREYLQAHAESIYNNILDGTKGPEADILARFVRQTWCSTIHEKLNNVLALKNDKHQYIVLQQRDSVPQIESFAGKDAPEQLLKIAEKIMHQFAVDTCGGHDANKIMTPFYGDTCDTKEEAEELNKRADGKGTVCQLRVWGNGRHEGKRDLYWVNLRDPNEKPKVEPPLMTQGCVVARVEEKLKLCKERKRIAQNVSMQLQNIQERGDKKRKLMSQVHS